MSQHSTHPDYLGHHYETPKQQFDSGSLGMWLFLATEVLLFAGLFCAYAIYRAHHPEVFVYAHQFLDKKLGALNTGVLIFSSFTMAMAVRQAQEGKNKDVVRLLLVTLVCGLMFLGVKKVEYEAKWKHGLLWGAHYKPVEHAAGHEGAGQAGLEAGQRAEASEAAKGGQAPAVGTPPPPVDPLAIRSLIEPSAPGPAGLAPDQMAPAHPAGEHGAPGSRPSNVHIFFGIYFLMTGLHGLHVIAGMSAIAWVLVRTMKGHFSAAYSTPVHLVGLYWHLVDLIWIYLFPLLYLIS